MATFKIRPFGEQFNTPYSKFRTLPVASAQTFEAGAVVTLTGGKITEAGTNPASIFGVVTAAHDAYDWQEDTHGLTEPVIPVALADAEFRGTLKGTFADADIGASYGLTEENDGIWVVDKAKTSTNARVTVLDIDRVATTTDGYIQEPVAGDTNVPVVFVVIPANRQVN